MSYILLFHYIKRYEVGRNNKYGMFYEIIGVGKLIITIIGTTFAYFSATNSNNCIFAFVTTIWLELTVTNVSTCATG